MSFDAWESSICPSGESLMHWGIRGMKHGRRRYQNEDGTWTTAGLEARRKREGFGERRAARKAARAERRAARKESASKARAAMAEKRRLRNVKKLTDEELQARINRLKLENEYKSLNKNPLVETGAKLIKAYFDAKDKKIKQENDRINMSIRDREARAKLANAKAAKINAKNDLLDNVIRGKGYMKAKEGLLKTKADTTIGGAIRKSINGIITKEGRNIAKDMPDHSIIVKGGRKVKDTVKKAYNTEKELIKAAYGGAGDALLNEKLKRANAKKKKAQGNPMKG